MDGFGLEGGGKRCPGKTGTLTVSIRRPVADRVRTGTSRAPTCWATTCSRRRAAEASPRIKISLPAARRSTKSKNETDVDFPSHMPWGCDAPAGIRRRRCSYRIGSDFKVATYRGSVSRVSSTPRCAICSTPSRFRGSTIHRLNRTAPASCGTPSTRSTPCATVPSGRRRSRTSRRFFSATLRTARCRACVDRSRRR